MQANLTVLNTLSLTLDQAGPCTLMTSHEKLAAEDDVLLSFVFVGKLCDPLGSLCSFIRVVRQNILRASLSEVEGR